MDKSNKLRIAEQLRSYVDRKGSQKKAANSMDGVSSATINKILNETDWETISEEMWRSVDAQTRVSSKEWELAETSTFNKLMFMLSEAQKDSLVFCVTGLAGSGKTETINHYASKHKNVYHLVCAEHWNRRTFVAKVLQCMGASASGCTINDMMEDVVDNLNRKETPLLVLDEADKISDQVLYFFITLYNQLEGKCGIVLCATSFLQSRIVRGLRLNKKGYQEIYSRIGRKFPALPIPSEEDICRVCIANGVERERDIKNIVKEATNSDNIDFRKVKREIWKLRKQEAKNGSSSK